MFPFRQACHYTPGRVRSARLIVVHDMEAPYGTRTAENVADWFAGSTSPRASAHFCVDSDSIVQSVKGGDTAWAAPKANADGLHIEHAGYARDSRAKWLAEEPMLNLSALVAAECVRVLRAFGSEVQVRRLAPAEIAARELAGFCGHADVTHAFRTPGGHTDPGDGFPWNEWLGKVNWWLPQIRDIDFQ